MSLSANIKFLTSSFFENCAIEEFYITDNLNTLNDRCLALTNLKSFTITNSITYISQTAFYGCKDLVLTIRSDHPVYYLLNNKELVQKSDDALVCLVGKVPSVYKLSSQIKILKDQSISSVTSYDSNGLVSDYGLTTLIIQNDIKVESGNPLYFCDFLYNLCYGGNEQPLSLSSNSLRRIFVSNNYRDNEWMIGDNTVDVIRNRCNTFTPYKSFSEHKYQVETCPYPDKPLTKEEEDIIITPTISTPSEIIESTETNAVVSNETTTTTNSFVDDQNTGGQPTKPDKSLTIVFIIISVCLLLIIILLVVYVVFLRKKANNEETEESKVVTKSK